MNLKKLVSRAALVTIGSAAALFGITSPAFAASDCANVAGSTSTGQNINLCGYPSFADSDVAIYGSVEFGSRATSATGCKLTAWGVLHIAGQQQNFETPRITKNCNDALANPNIGYGFAFWRGPTSATQAQGKVCVDLYYNGSTSSGWQRCNTGPWTYKG